MLSLFDLKAPARVTRLRPPPPVVSDCFACNLHTVSSPVLHPFTSPRGDGASASANRFWRTSSWPESGTRTAGAINQGHMSSSSVVGRLDGPVGRSAHSSSAIGHTVKSSAHSSSSIVAHTVTGSHVLMINGYSGTKGLDNGSYIKSDKFDIGGYLWVIRYYPDGDGTEYSGWISFSLHLDEKYATGVDAIVNFSLLYSVGEPVPSYSEGSSVINTFDRRNHGWVIRDFIEKKALEESTYLTDDCFRIRCDVTVLKEISTEGTSHFVIVPPSDMNQHIGRLLSLGVETDVTFEVGQKTFAAHRLVLGARSSVFMAELLGPLKEKNRHIRIDGMEPRVFKAMLHFIYTDSLPKMHKHETYTMAQHLLVAADRYDLERLKLMCEDKLCNCINTRMVTTTLVLAEKHGCKGLKKACFKFLKSPGHIKKIMDSDEFQYLTSSCPSLVNELLANVAP